MLFNSRRIHFALRSLAFLMLLTFVVGGSSGFCGTPGSWIKPGAFIDSPINGAVVPYNQPISFSGATIYGTHFKWNFGDGTVQQWGQSLTHTYTAPGTYTVTLYVSGNIDGNPSQPSTTSVQLTVAPGGAILPKYQVISVIYAPPGSSSSVTYGSSTTLGTSSSISKSFSNSLSVSAKLGVGYGGTGITGTFSSSWTKTINNTDSIAVNKSESSSSRWPGPLSSHDGINHDMDVILLLLNPKISWITPAGGALQWSLGFDPRDPAGEAEIVPVYVAFLKNPALMAQYAPDLVHRLARTWATGPDAGLNSQDFATILGRNPFWNDGLSGSSPLDTDPRFQLVAGSTFSYVPPPPGGQPSTQTYFVGYQTIEAWRKTVTDSYTVGFAWEAGVDLVLKSKLTISDSINYTNVVTKETSVSQGQTATVSITGPASAYTGPVSIKVYRDNLYGSFFFAYVR